MFAIPAPVVVVVMAAMVWAAWKTRDDGLRFSAVTVATVWVLWTAFIYAACYFYPDPKDGAYEPWQFGLFLDGLAAHALFIPGLTRSRMILIGLYALEVAAHIAYGFTKVALGHQPWQIYGDALDVLAILQIITVGGASGLDLLRGRGIHPLDRSEASGAFQREAGREK